jgi:hypothetical protein
MEGQGDSCRIEPLEERGRNSAVGFDMCLTLKISGGREAGSEEDIFLLPSASF